MSRPLAAGMAALRRFYRPFLLIQAAALLVVLSYHWSASLREFCTLLAAIKVRGGLPFAALSASLAGALLPEVAKWIGDGRRFTLAGRRAELAFNFVFFAFNGVVIDILYRGEARLFGVDAAATTVAKKVAFDQFVFTPVWLALIIALFMWRNERFSLRATLTALRLPGFYSVRVVPLLLSAWCFWIPMVCVIYALPVPLQFVLFILALGAWSLIMVFVANASADKDQTSSGAAP
ncbi:MAG: hypothetical protein ABI560_16490 [Myxococcales bacterium]